MKNLILITLLVFSTGIFAQKVVGDATLPANIEYNGVKMELNGAGMREKLWIDLYAGGLYLTNKSNDENAVINASDPMGIRLNIVSSMVTQHKMIEAVNEGFENTTTGKATPEEIAKFTGFFNEPIVKGNIFDLIFMKGEVTVYKDGVRIGSVSGLDFKKALFGIWLSAKPADKNLKKAMLGN